MDFDEMDSTTKVLLIIVIAIVAFIVGFLILRNVIHDDASVSTTAGYGGMMQGFGFGQGPSEFQHTLVTAISLLFAAVVALIASITIKTRKGKSQKSKAEKIKGSVRNELSIIKKALSVDEKKLVEEVEKAEEITQDSLRFRLEWSKAKVSTIISNLDRMGIIQRKREGKTYSVSLQKKR